METIINPPPRDDEDKALSGVLIGAIIVIVVLLLGIFVLWPALQKDPQEEGSNVQINLPPLQDRNDSGGEINY